MPARASARQRTHEALGWTWITDTGTGRTRRVRGDCRRCFPPGRATAGGHVVSPTGVVHSADRGTTLCGCDATRKGWLWPE